MSLDQVSSPVDASGAPKTPKSAGSHNGNDLPLPPRPTSDVPSETLTVEIKEGLDHVLQSDIAITTLLTRLKQSISSARDFAAFLKERSVHEEKHAHGLKRISQSTQETIRRPESRQGSFAESFKEITRIHERMADHGFQFASNLQTMSEELQDLALNCEKGRKHWKQTGLSAEKRAQDAESAMDKAKTKYNSLAEQYDRARTGERQSGKFGLKGHKSAAQQEEDLHRKVEAADGDYFSKVQTAQAQRQELLTTSRPQAVNALQELVKECDAGLSMQVQKFAVLNEKLLLAYGLCVSPLRSQSPGPSAGSRSLREVASSIDNRKDLVNYLFSFTNKAGSRPPEIKYEKHPALSPKQQQQTQPPAPSFGASQPQFGQVGRTDTNFDPYVQTHKPSQSAQISGVLSHQFASGDGLPVLGQPGQYPSGPHPPIQGYPVSRAPQLSPIEPLSPSSGADTKQRPEAGLPSGSGQEYRGVFSSMGQNRSDQPPLASSENNSAFRPLASSVNSDNQQTTATPSGTVNPYGPPPNGMNGGRAAGQPGMPANGYQYDIRDPSNQRPGSRGPPLGPYGDLRSDNRGPPAPQNGAYRPQGPHLPGPTANMSASGSGSIPPSTPRRPETNRPNLAPTKPVFGVPLNELFRRDGSAVPAIVYQCVQAVDLFGLETEGIYRTSGSAHHIMEMKAMFDHDSSQVDFRNPAAFHHDIASVTTLLKHFLRDLPDPLLTSAQYSAFIQSAKIEDDTVRRDSLHAIINSLPDPNYATLRVLTLHLDRVAQKSEKNRMTPGNLAIVFGPTLMGQQSTTGQTRDIRDAALQARVVETILNNTFQIFDDDE